MKLTYLERLTLSNQYKILEALYPDDADSYAIARRAIDEGYELEYDLINGPDKEEMSEEECREVRDILSMYRAIENSKKRTQDPEINNNHRLEFAGFDGNGIEEARYMSYVEFLYKKGQWEELTEDGWKNSHGPVIHRYRSMLELWKSLPSKFELNDDDLKQLAAAGFGR